MDVIPHFQTAKMSGMHSQFGGFWADRTDAGKLLHSGLKVNGEPTPVTLFQQWIDKGFVTLKKAIPEQVVDAINDDVSAAWNGAHPNLYCEYKGVKKIKPFMKEQRVKLLDLYTVSEATRTALACPTLVNFLTQLFEYPPMVFQSLYFEYGSTQPMHQDTAYVKVSSPMKFVGVWIALEDIQPNSGELEYYEGSHKLSEWVWREKYKNMPYEELFKPSHDEFLESLHTKAKELRLKRVVHRPQKGDVLVWHADLVHGGCQDVNRDLTRKSLAVHYCPADISPYYFFTTGGTGPLELGNNCFQSFQHHRVEPPSLTRKIRRKLIKLVSE